MSASRLIGVSIPFALLVGAVACTNGGGLVLVLGLAGGTLGFFRSVRRPHSIRPYVSWPIAFFAVLASVYFTWGAFILVGTPDVWPRPLPYPDKAVLAIHESVNHPSAMPFGNHRTLSIIGFATVLIMAIAGRHLGNCLQGTATRHNMIRAWDQTYNDLLPILAGSAVGLCLGLFGALLTYDKRSPLPLMMILIGTFGGALLGWRWTDAPLHCDTETNPNSTNVAEPSNAPESRSRAN